MKKVNLSHFVVKETEATEVDSLPTTTQLVKVVVSFVSLWFDSRARVN